MSEPRRLVVGVSGATGIPYAARLLAFLRDNAAAQNLEPHVVLTKMGRACWEHEVPATAPDSYGFPIWGANDFFAPMASGSARFDGMVIIPCSASCSGRIAQGVGQDLDTRAADVMLKGKKQLVLVLREAPYSLVHLRNMTAVTEAGAVILPASPAFYSGASTVEGLVDTVVCRALDLLGVENDLMKRWEGR